MRITVSYTHLDVYKRQDMTLAQLSYLLWATQGVQKVVGRKKKAGFQMCIRDRQEDILAATKVDKKMENGTLKFILLNGIGNAFIDRTVTDEEILDAVNYFNADLRTEADK